MVSGLYRSITVPERKPNGHFAPGNKIATGKPKDTPEVKAAKELLRKKSKRAAEVLIEIMETSDDEKLRLAAAGNVLDRVLGKPTQKIAGDSEHDPVEIDAAGIREELIRRLSNAAKG